MLISDIKRVVEQVSKDKGIDTGVLIKTLEEALTSAARNASAWIVMVGCPRPDVTKLEPSQMNRLRTSCVRWWRSTTEDFGSSPMRQVPTG